MKARLAITTQDGHFKGKYDEDKLKYCTVMVSMKKKTIIKGMKYTDENYCQSGSSRMTNILVSDKLIIQ